MARPVVEDLCEVSHSWVPTGKGTLNTHAWWSRHDPLWELRWDDIAGLRWEFPALSRIVAAHRGDGVIGIEERRVFSPVDVGENKLYSEPAIRLMAIVVEFGMVTTEQALILAGWRANFNRGVAVLADLWAAGALMRMRIPSTAGKFTYVWSPARRESYGALREWLNRAPLWVKRAVCGGLDPLDGTDYSNRAALRHNVVTMDILLRAMETCPDVIGIWGERHTRAQAFADQKVLPGEDARNNIGDGAMVTRTGRVIILESTNGATSRPSDVAAKVGAWVAICARSDIDVSVVFVDIAERMRAKRLFSMVEWGTREVCKRYIADTRLREEGKRRIFVGHAKNWFPAPRMIGSPFLRLECVSPVDRARHDVLPGDETMDYGNPAVAASLIAMHNPVWIASKTVADRDEGALNA